MIVLQCHIQQGSILKMYMYIIYAPVSMLCLAVMFKWISHCHQSHQTLCCVTCLCSVKFFSLYFNIVQLLCLHNFLHWHTCSSQSFSYAVVLDHCSMWRKCNCHTFRFSKLITSCVVVIDHRMRYKYRFEPCMIECEVCKVWNSFSSITYVGEFMCSCL